MRAFAVLLRLNFDSGERLAFALGLNHPGDAVRKEWVILSPTFRHLSRMPIASGSLH